MNAEAVGDLDNKLEQGYPYKIERGLPSFIQSGVYERVKEVLQ